MKRYKKRIAALGLAAVMAMGTSITSFAGSWQHDGIGWWYLKDDDSYLKDTFWTDENNNTYYFTGRGYMVTGWKQIQNNWYYFTESGAMLKEAQTPDGYWVGADGIWVQ
ncbi:MAG: hypothetical protein Q4F76_11220 [Lachnospiraceae bacterium]|nr:hypothetical protein [Lachnospiraceae bacterium]